MNQKKEQKLEILKVEMRELSKYTPSEVDVKEFLKKELEEETQKLGKPFGVRTYLTGHMLKLAQQLGKTLDSNYIILESKYGKIIIGCNDSDIVRYYDGDPFDTTLRKLKFYSTEERKNLLKGEN